MSIQTMILIASIAGAILFFMSGYLLAPRRRADFELDDEDFESASASAFSRGDEEDEGIYSVPTQLIEDGPALDPGRVRSVEQSLDQIARHYEADQYGIYDADGLLVQGQPQANTLGLSVAGLVHGLSYLPAGSDSAKRLQVDDTVVQRLDSQVQPLWLAMQGGTSELCAEDRVLLVKALDREFKQAA